MLQKLQVLGLVALVVMGLSWMTQEEEGNKPAEQAPQVEDQGPVIKEKIAALEAAFKKSDDDGALGMIDELTKLAQAAEKEDKGKIAKAFAKAFDLRRKDNRVVLAATASLSSLGDEGAKPLIAASKDKKYKKSSDDDALTIRISIVKALGQTKSEEGVGQLLYLLKDKDYAIMAAAADGLANYKEADEKIRKKAFNELLKELVTAEVVAQDIQNTEAKEKYDTIGASYINALKELSGQNFSQPGEFERWWNSEGKKKPW